MKLQKLEVTGFLSYAQEVVNFDGLDYVSITGENGAGKSTITLAITWALMGTLRVKGEMDSVVNDESDEAIVSLEFEHEGTEYRVVRSKVYGGSMKVRLYRKRDDVWIQHGDHLNATAQNEIYDVIGMNEDAWFSLVLMDAARFSGGTRFTKADSQDRRNILMDLVPELDRWATWHGEAYERRTEAGRDADRLERALEDAERSKSGLAEDRRELETNLDQSDSLDDLDKKAKRLDKKIGKKSAELGQASSAKDGILSEKRAAKAEYTAKAEKARNALTSLQAELEIVEEAQEDVDKFEARIAKMTDETIPALQKDLDEKRKALEEGSKEIATADKNYERLVRSQEEAQDALSSLRAQLRDAEERDEELSAHDHENGVCPFCHSQLTPKRFADLVKEAADKSETLKSEMNKQKRQTERARERAQDLAQSIKKLSTVQNQARSAVSGIESDLRNAERRLAEFKDDLKDARKDLRSHDSAEVLKTKIDEAETAIEKINSRWLKKDQPAFDKRLEQAEGNSLADAISREIADLRAQREKITRRRSRLDQMLGQIEAIDRQYTKVSEDIVTLKREKQGIDDLLEDLEFLVKALNSRGIPSMLIDSVLGAIEDRQNEILAGIPGAEGLRVEFRQQKGLKSREGSKEVLDIIVHTPSGYSRPIESFSSGELVRLTISNLFAMIAVFNERTPGLVTTVFLDEPLGTLDQKAVPAFVEVLQSVLNSRIVSSIFVITHDQRVIDALPQQIVVTKSTDGGSSINVIS